METGKKILPPLIQIAIDGPAGAGKSTVAKIIANRLNILYLDTGAMYRSIAYYALKCGVGSEENSKLEELFESFDLSFNENNSVFLNGEDITNAIRSPQMDIAVSAFAVNPYVRRKLVELQQAIGRRQSIVMEGRDIGTVVLKDSPYKFYLDAGTDERARRRFIQNQEKGLSLNFEDIKKDMIRRDAIDSLKGAKLHVSLDAHVIDSSALNAEGVADVIINYIKGS